MSLKDRLDKGPARKSNVGVVAHLLDTLDLGEKNALESALRDERWGPTDLARTLRAEGHAVTVDAVRRWREANL